jgi:hypothetical protein
MTFKRIIILCLLVVGNFCGSAQISTWAKSVGGIVRKTKVVNNALYACGSFFFAKYSLTGDLIWIQTIPGTGQAYDIAIANGYVYVTGFYRGAVNFNPQGNNTIASNNNSFDVFIAKYNEPDGAYIYANGFGGPTTDIGNTIEADAMNNIYIGGQFTSAANFSISGGNNTVTGNDADNVKGFLAKYAAQSSNVYSLSWLNTYMGADITQAHNSNVYTSVTNESASVIYIAGFFSGSNTSFNSSEGNFVLSPTQSSGMNNRNAFVACYSLSTGKCVSAKSLQSPLSSEIRDIDLYNGDLYVVGDLRTTSVTSINFDLNGGSNLRSTTGALDDIFIAKYNADTYAFGFGNIIGCGSTAPPQPVGPIQRFPAGNGISVNATGVYITGGFWGTTDFNPGTGTVNLIGSGSYRDIFFARYSLTGEYIGAQKVGAANDDAGYSIAATPTEFYVSGFNGTSNTDFDPGAGTLLLSSAGFLAGYSSAAVLPVSINDFYATVDRSMVNLFWKTTSEFNNAGFHVEFFTGTEWKVAGFVSGKGNSLLSSQYSFSHFPKTGGTILYRLLQEDTDGKRTASPIVKVSLEARAFNVSVSPNPVNRVSFFYYTLSENSSVTLTIYDVNGRIIKGVNENNKEAGYYQMPIDGSKYAKGIYYYRFSAGTKNASGAFVIE